MGCERVGRNLVMKRLQLAVRRGRYLLLQAMQQMGTPLAGIGQTRPQSLGVQAQAQHIHGRLQQPGRHAVQQQRHDGIGGHQVPVSVHGQRRTGLVALEHQLYGLARGGQIGMVQRAGLVHGGKARRHQQCIALAQRHRQALGQAQHHLAAGLGAPCFHIAQVACRDLGLQCQPLLAQPTVLAPVAQVFAERRARAGRQVSGMRRRGGGAGSHGRIVVAGRICGHDLRGYRRCARGWQSWTPAAGTGPAARTCFQNRSLPCPFLLLHGFCAM